MSKDTQINNTPVDNDDSLLHRLSSIAATVTFFLLLAASLTCLGTASIYLYRFQSHTEEIKRGFQAEAAPVGGYLDITKLQVSAISVAYQTRIELLSTGVYVGLAFGFLGFALIVIGVRGDISGSGSHGGTTVSLSHLSPGVFVIVCSAALIAICTTRSLPLDINSTGSSGSAVQANPESSASAIASQEDEHRPFVNLSTRKTHDSNPKSNTTADQLWDSMNQFAKEGFELMTKEAEERSEDGKSQLWERRTSAFHSAEEKLIDWVRENSIPPYAQQGFPPNVQLQIDFRAALYNEYSGDYYDARNLFSECQQNPSLHDPTAIWNGTPISSLVQAHFDEMIMAARGVQSQIMSLNASIAQSYGPPDGTEEQRYEYIHKAQKDQLKVQGDDVTSLIQSGAKVTLHNDSKQVVLKTAPETTAK